MFVRALSLCLFLWLYTGCGSCGTKGQDPITYNGGTTAGDTYESNPWTGEWLHFPPGRIYRFPHGLGSDEIEIRTYLAFARVPFPEGVGSAAPAAGNLGVIEEMTAQAVQLRNDTCEDEIYVRVVIVRNN